MKYLFFKDTDITLEQYESIFQDPSDAVRETWQTITRLEDGWFMVLANDTMELPFPNVDINHVYNTFVKMPAGPKIELTMESVRQAFDAQRRATIRSAIEANERRVFVSPTESKEWSEGYNAYMRDLKSKALLSENPYDRIKNKAEHRKARDWNSGYEAARSKYSSGGNDAPCFEPGQAIDMSEFDAGALAAKEGLGLQSNPFTKKSASWVSWREGWISINEKPAIL